MPIIVYVHIHLGRAYFKARGVKKDSVPDRIKIELTNIPVNSPSRNTEGRPLRKKPALDT